MHFLLFLKGDEKMINKDKFPSNSFKSREKKEEKERPKIEKVVSNDVVKKKKGFLQKIVGNFMGEDVDSVGAYIVQDVLIPSARDMLFDTIKNGSEMLIYGEAKGAKRNRSGKPFVSYNKVGDRREERDKRDYSINRKARYDFDDIIITSRAECEEVIERLTDLILEFEVASVSDFYDMLGMKGEFTDNKYGWDKENFNHVRAVRVKGGYIIDLPRVKLLD